MHFLTAESAKGNFLTIKSAKGNFAFSCLGREPGLGDPGNPARGGPPGNPGPRTPEPLHRLLWNTVRTPLGKPSWRKIVSLRRFSQLL